MKNSKIYITTRRQTKNRRIPRIVAFYRRFCLLNDPDFKIAVKLKPRSHGKRKSLEFILHIEDKPSIVEYCGFLNLTASFVS